MVLLLSSMFAGETAVSTHISTLNAVWLGRITRPFPLPNLGHIYLIFPGETAVSCNNVTLNPGQYSWLTDVDEPIILTGTAVTQSPCLVLLLSPGFALEMADFLGISPELNQLMHNVPLPQGDELSYLLAEMVKACTPPLDLQTADDLMLEVVGELLRMMRFRQQALAALAPRKQSTVDDLLPRLLQARQLVEARFLEELQVADVATAVSLSQFHFARLFKAAFGESLYQFIKRLRLDEARFRLMESDLSVTEVSLQVGYSSLSSFINAFRRRFGMSPSQYRTLFES